MYECTQYEHGALEASHRQLTRTFRQPFCYVKPTWWVWTKVLVVRCQRQLDDVSMNTMIYYIPAVLTREMSFPVLMAWCASTAPVVEKVQQLPHAPYPQKGGGRKEGGKEEGEGRRERRRRGREEEMGGGEGGGEGEGGKGGWEKEEGNGRSMPVTLTDRNNVTYFTSSCNTSCTPNHITHHTTHTIPHTPHTTHSTHYTTCLPHQTNYNILCQAVIQHNR